MIGKLIKGMLKKKPLNKELLNEITNNSSEESIYDAFIEAGFSEDEARMYTKKFVWHNEGE